LRGARVLCKTLFLLSNVAFDQVVEDSVRGLGFELVELERLAGGLLRVTIDVPWQEGSAAERAVDVDDCERVSRQLQSVFEVEGVDYRRLEVSSPGLDRPLRREADFERFRGERIEVRFKVPRDLDATGGRKTFCGVLGQSAEGRWEIVWRAAEAPRKAARRNAPKVAPAPEQAVVFELDELESARLAPVLDFKGRHVLASGVAD
jgi:ribosome maturation factor RimP